MFESGGDNDPGEGGEHINPYGQGSPFHNPYENTGDDPQTEITAPGGEVQPAETELPSVPAERLPTTDELLAFIMPHDGTQLEVSRAEAAMVTTKFDSLFDDLMLGHVDATHQINILPYNETRLRLRAPAADNNWISISVSEYDEPMGYLPSVEPHKKIRRSIYVQPDSVTQAGTAYIYREYADHSVRRFTITIPEHQQVVALLDTTPDLPHVDAPAKEQEAHREKSEEVVQNIQESRNLARALGMQDQPIGVAEMDSLADLLSRPDIATIPPPPPPPPPGYYRRNDFS